MSPHVPVPRPSYSQARENLLRAIPPKLICLLACGGRDCRYEGPACWRPSQQAILGLFSTWVTDDIVAMARPSTHLIKRYSIIEQFQQLNIKSIINMQVPGEHPYCGPAFEPGSGFTYSPQIFMEKQIFFFNFGMLDFGVSSLVWMLDAVKVLAFAVQEGKVAVHCHAGLGRTGVLIACYLIFMLRVSASEAVHYVRLKRPRSIQTHSQINLVFDFARLLGTQLTQYPVLSLRHGGDFTLKQYLQRQNLLLHGQEARALAHTPKVLHLLCSQLAALALGRPSPVEVQVELDRKTAILALRRAVRDTLAQKKVLWDRRVLRRTPSMDSVSSWDDPLGFLERKREVLLNKRCYSESDLSKIAVSEVGDFTQYSAPLAGHLRICNGLASQSDRPGSTDPALNTPTRDRCNGTVDRHTQYLPLNPEVCNGSTAKRTKGKAKKKPAFSKYNSNMELCKNHRETAQVTASKAVAKAMAELDPLGERVLSRTAVLQDELNGSEYGWATLLVETDPKVMSSLLWTWLDKLKEPILSTDDIERLTSNIQNKNHLTVLNKSQHHTISCLLGCVGQVTRLCPQYEHLVIQRLIQALTRRLPEEIKSYAALLKLLKTTMRELHHLNSFPKRRENYKSS